MPVPCREGQHFSELPPAKNPGFYAGNFFFADHLRIFDEQYFPLNVDIAAKLTFIP